MIAPQDLELMRVCDDPAEVVEIVRAGASLQAVASLIELRTLTDGGQTRRRCRRASSRRS